MKVVINRCFGGFSISRQCAEYMAARGNERARRELAECKKDFYGYGYVEGMEDGYDRTDPDLISAIETMGDEVNGQCANLKLVEIPDGIEWEIDEYDGLETIEECHRSWR